MCILILKQTLTLTVTLPQDNTMMKINTYSTNKCRGAQYVYNMAATVTSPAWQDAG